MLLIKKIFPDNSNGKRFSFNLKKHPFSSNSSSSPLLQALIDWHKICSITRDDNRRESESLTPCFFNTDKHPFLEQMLFLTHIYDNHHKYMTLKNCISIILNRVLYDILSNFPHPSPCCYYYYSSLTRTKG